MTYKARPGIVLVNVCDAHLLVATRSLWSEFPRVRPISRLWAACWTLMEKDNTDQDAVLVFRRLFSMSEEDVRKRFAKMFSTLAEEGYLIPAEDER